MTDNHGNTPAAWTAVVVALAGFVVGGIGLMVDSMTTFWVGVALAPVGAGRLRRHDQDGLRHQQALRPMDGPTRTQPGRRAAGRSRPPSAPSRRAGSAARCSPRGSSAGSPSRSTCATRTLAGSWGYCPWLALTGQYCPGCGSLRAVNDLDHGDLLGAASSNLVFVAMVPLLVLGGCAGCGAPGRDGQPDPCRGPARRSAGSGGSPW